MELAEYIVCDRRKNGWQCEAYIKEQWKGFYVNKFELNDVNVDINSQGFVNIGSSEHGEKLIHREKNRFDVMHLLQYMVDVDEEDGVVLTAEKSNNLLLMDYDEYIDDFLFGGKDNRSGGRRRKI